MKNVFEIQDGVLVHCEVNNPDVIIPDGVRKIAYSAFKQEDDFNGTDKLKTVVIPESVEDIDNEAFQYCKNLSKVTILGPADIGREAFLSCSNLKTVYLADGVRVIGAECFAYCDKLEELYIPESVTEIGWDIVRMNDASYRRPLFRCYRQGIGTKWSPIWNRKYNDPRFGDDKSHFFYHETFWGETRDGQKRQDTERQPAENMPHGTGQYLKAAQMKHGKEVRMPDIRLRLCLSATILDVKTSKEYQLNDEEREMLPRTLLETDVLGAETHPLDTPWEITVNEDTLGLADELDITAWINDYNDVFDGKTLVVHHVMPFHKSPYDDYPVTLLHEGETAIAEQHIWQNNATYDVRLSIEWLKQEKKTYTLEQVLEHLRSLPATWKYNDKDNEIQVLLAHGSDSAKAFKAYKPSEFPEQFIEELQAEPSLLKDLKFISIQPYEFYEEEHSYSDDYIDAATAYGEDCDDWTTTERRKTGERINYEL